MDLPEEVLADILRRVVPPRHRAECRRVCGYWRDTIDRRRLVLRHLLPAARRGAFINFKDYGWGGTYFFARGGCGGVDACLADAPTSWCTVVDHCNGLLLCEATEGPRFRFSHNPATGAIFVYNPATRRSATLPPLPRADPSAAYLVFDPAVSLHHEVFLLPEMPSKPQCAQPDDLAPLPPFNVAGLFFTADGESSQPPLMGSDEDDGEDCVLLHDRWEERAFVREGGAAGAVVDMWSDPLSPNDGPRRNRCAAYWGRSLYVHCHGSFIIRLSLLTGKYVVIKTPEVVNMDEHWRATQHLSKSQKGVYYTAVAGLELRVWVLNEKSTTVPSMWEMVHHATLMPSLLTIQEKEKSWILDDPSRRESTEQGYNQWDSDDDGGVNVAEQGGSDNIDQYMGWLDFLGYHPDKEIVFFSYQYEHCAFAYYLRTSKLEYLGDLVPRSWNHSFPTYGQESFVYTPCRIDLLSDQNGTSVDLSNWV